MNCYGELLVLIATVNCCYELLQRNIMINYYHERRKRKEQQDKAESNQGHTPNNVNFV